MIISQSIKYSSKKKKKKKNLKKIGMIDQRVSDFLYLGQTWRARVSSQDNYSLQQGSPNEIRVEWSDWRIDDSIAVSLIVTRFGSLDSLDCYKFRFF